MTKYLITSGCSFTAHSVEPTIAWPYHMKDWQVINCAEMASGNSLISRNLIATIPHYIDENPTVAVMWSNPNRFELFYNTESNNYDKIYNTMKDIGGFLNQPYTGKWKPHKTSNWAKSGGGFGLWDFDSKELNQDMKLYLENFHNEELQFVQTLEHILRIQWYCKVHNLKLINMCWQDIFTGKNDSHGNNSNEHGELIVNQFENAVHLWEQVDWSTWWFHNNYGGLREWCIDHNYTQFSESHPTTEAQKHFAKSVIGKLLND